MKSYKDSLTGYLHKANIMTQFVSTDPYDQSDFMQKQAWPYHKTILDGFTIDSYPFALILETRARRLKEKGYDYNPLIISGRHKSEFIEHLIKLSNIVTEHATRRFDVIAQVMIDQHATAISLFVSYKKIECIYIDPSIDQRNLASILEWSSVCMSYDVHFSHHGYQNTDHPLQNDTYSCLPYAESLLHKMHRMTLDELKAAIPKGENFKNIAPCLMKYTQSMNIMAEYMHLKPLAQFGLSKKYSYAELKQKQFREIATSSSYSFGTEQVHSKTQNRGLDFLRESGLQKAADLIKTLSSEEVDAISKKRVNPQLIV